MPAFSRRLAWDAPHNALSRRLDEKRAAGQPILDLTVSNPTRVGIAYPEDEIRRALADPRLVRYEPSPQGLESARQAVAAYYAERGFPVDPEHLLLTASTSEAYAFLFKLLCDPGDAVLVPRPSYPLFDFLAALEGVELVPYPLAWDGAWSIDIAALQQALDEAVAAGRKLRAILIVSPNNPTGSFLKKDERAFLVALARAHDLALIADEVFSDYAFGADERRVDTLVDEREVLAFSLSGLSKVLGLPQLKLGWISVGGPVTERAAVLGRLELVADTYLSIGAPVQLATAALLGMRRAIAGAIEARVRKNLVALQQELAGTACQLLPVEGGWYGVIRVPAIHSDEAWALLLLDEEGVLVQPGYFYDFAREAYLVVSLLPEPPTFREGIRRLVARAQ